MERDAPRSAPQARAVSAGRLRRGRRHLSEAQPVRRRVRQDPQRLCREARREQADRRRRSTACCRRSIRIRATWTPSAFATCRTQTKGEFGGLGIEVTQEDGLIKVVTPIDDTPAAKAGMHVRRSSSPRSTTIPTQGMTLDQAVDKMRGAINSPVKLKIVRGPKKDRSRIQASSATLIHVQSVRSQSRGRRHRLYPHHPVHRADGETGCERAMDKLQQEIPADKFKGYILDLRNNPGGLLDQSIEVVNSFIDKGEIVSTRGPQPRRDAALQRPARRRSVEAASPSVVLINGGSASASEIVAGALQDHKRATLIGTRSFGKGSRADDHAARRGNGALRLTTARYYTPSGRSIQAKGIEPDIKVLEDVPDDLKGKDDNKGEASLKGHLETAKRTRPARRPMSRRTRRTTSSSSRRSICCTGSSLPRRAVKADAGPGEERCGRRRPLRRPPGPNGPRQAELMREGRERLDEERSLVPRVWSRAGRCLVGDARTMSLSAAALEHERQARALRRSVQQSARQLCREA